MDKTAVWVEWNKALAAKNAALDALEKAEKDMGKWGDLLTQMEAAEDAAEAAKV